jgi:signal transduction histidine kinase/integral membrane sensor domain MASE1
LPFAISLLLFAPLILIGNEAGSLLRYPDIGSAVLFPPFGILTASLVVSPRRDWLWYLLIGSAAHFATHWPQWSVSWVLLADAANATRALIAAVLLRWLCDGPPRLDSIRELALFVLGAVVVAPAIGAVIGAANVVLHGGSTTYWRAWSGWFVSNALTGLTFLPAFIVLFGNATAWRRARVSRARIIEAILLTLLLSVSCAIAFLGGSGSRQYALLLYAPLPALIWVALRFGSGGASFALSAVAAAAVWGVDRGTGPLLASSPDDNVFVLQIFVLLTSVPVLCLAAIETARENTVQLYRALLSSLQDHVAVLDARGLVLEVNESWQRFAARAGTDAVHRVAAGDHFLEACRAAAGQGDASAEGMLAGVTSVLNRALRRFEMEYEHHVGRRLEAFTMIVEALERTDGGAVVTRANVTARRRAQIEVEAQRRELSHLARVSVLGQLSGAFAHELNQPLTAILSNAETGRQLLRRQPADLDQLAAILGDIVSDNQRAAAVIHRLRALLKRGERRVQRLEAGELVDEVLDLARTELSARHVNVSVIVEPDLPPFIGDKVQLQQVLLNFILNGCEAMSATAPTDRRLVISVRHDPTVGLHFAICDAGTGIAPDLLDRLFEPFVTTKPDGLGLGLSISRTIVAAHGGRLWAENNPYGGATMHCLLPVRDVLPPEASAELRPELTAIQDR